MYKSLPLYRIAFFEALREELVRHAVDLRLIYGQPAARDRAKQDTGDIAWAERIRNRILSYGERDLYWQPCVTTVRGSDLVIVEQASKLLVNCVLLGLQRVGWPRLAFWGHGRNLQATSNASLPERLKRFTSTKAHWWFAYSDATAHYVEALGFPAERITVVQNAIGTEALSAARRPLSDLDLASIREELGLTGTNVGLFAGGLYEAKRLDLLIDAAVEVRRRVPDFELLVVGAGPEEEMIRAAARRHTWVRYAGPRFGQEKVGCFAVARALLVPGVVGLVAVDSFALRVPLVTIDQPGHGPEIDYIEKGVNGIVLPASTSPADYARAVATLLTDERTLDSLRRGCDASAAVYTLEAMVERFADGVIRALDTP